MATHDNFGRAYAKLSELKQGDWIDLDSGFSCTEARHTIVLYDHDGLYYRCKHGRHYLIGQADDGEHCIGIYPA